MLEGKIETRNAYNDRAFVAKLPHFRELSGSDSEAIVDSERKPQPGPK